MARRSLTATPPSVTIFILCISPITQQRFFLVAAEGSHLLEVTFSREIGEPTTAIILNFEIVFDVLIVVF